MQIDRRRSPRIELVGQLTGESQQAAGRELVVREISLGGMAIESPDAFEVGSTHVFRLTMGDGSAVELTGLIRHCRPVDAADPGSPLVIGVEFADDEPGESGERVGGLLDRLR
jgi:hypothetical protein